MSQQLGITVKKKDDFSEWYSQLVQKAELGDLRYNVKGFLVYLPWATRTIRKMYSKYEAEMDATGHEPLTMPSLIPERNFNLEKDHVEGFTPEVFWVTEHGQGEKFEERLALRPTSETALYPMYSLWIRSYKDLPFKRYQSCQVWRCEGKMTRPFFRAREFHWIESHNVYATHEEALAQVKEDMEITLKLLQDEFAIPAIFFKRPQWDKFAGALNTYAADALMDSGKVLQLPSTHDLGQNFAKAFGVKFVDKDGSEKHGWITCYGPAISRIYGAMIALLGDDNGLVLPFDLAPLQAVIVPILFDKSSDAVLKRCNEVKKQLEKLGLSAKVDTRDEKPGFKFHHWELKGVPIRIEVGPKDLENKQVVLCRRDIGEKTAVADKDFDNVVKDIKAGFTDNIKKKHFKKFEDRMVNAKNTADIKKGLDSGKIVRCEFCSDGLDGVPCAEVVEKECGGFVRGTRADKEEEPKGYCAICEKESKEIVYIAKSY